MVPVGTCARPGEEPAVIGGTCPLPRADRPTPSIKAMMDCLKTKLRSPPMIPASGQPRTFGTSRNPGSPLHQTHRGPSARPARWFHRGGAAGRLFVYEQRTARHLYRRACGALVCNRARYGTRNLVEEATGQQMRKMPSGPYVTPPRSHDPAIELGERAKGDSRRSRSRRCSSATPVGRANDTQGSSSFLVHVNNGARAGRPQEEDHQPRI